MIKKVPKRLVAECADEFHIAVKLHARKHEFESMGAFILWACQKMMAEQKTAPLKEEER